MENITIGQIFASIISLASVVGAIVVFVKLYKYWRKTTIDNKNDNFDKRLIDIEKRMSNVEKIVEEQGNEIRDSKEERLVLLNGLLACLKGLHNDLNCNGPVTKGIEDIETYLIKKTHEN